MKNSFARLICLCLLLVHFKAAHGRHRSMLGASSHRHRHGHQEEPQVPRELSQTSSGRTGGAAEVEQSNSSTTTQSSPTLTSGHTSHQQDFSVRSSWQSTEPKGTVPLSKPQSISDSSSQPHTASSNQSQEFPDDHVSAWLDLPKDPFTWDGESSWEWENPRTLYFEPVAGLGNRLRALASAVVMAKEYGVGLKVIWREEIGCKECHNPGFNSTWQDLFSEPRLRLAENFPGSTYSADEELMYLRAEGRDDKTPPLQDNQCAIHYPHSHQDMVHAMTNGWTMVNGEEILCVKSDLWLTEAGEKEGKFFFRLLKPSPMVQSMMDRFKFETEWEENHMVGVHVRRTDLTIWGKNGKHDAVKGLIPIETYIETMKAQKQLAAGVKRVRFFLATDDAEAEAQIRAAFKPGYVLSYEKKTRSRNSVQGIQEALADVMLLADCPVLIGTYYSSYSETAKMMGWPFYIQVGHDLKRLSIETKFEKDDPDEDETR